MSIEETTKTISRAMTTGEKKGVNSKSKGEKDKELYIQWKSIPAMLRILPEAELKKMGYDTGNPVFMKLLSIKTQGELCKEFGIGINQPAVWDKHDDTEKRIQHLANKNNVMKFQKDVDFSFTQKVLRHGDAHRMKLWKQLYEGWTEKIDNRNVNMNFDMVEIVKAIEERNAKIRGK